MPAFPLSPTSIAERHPSLAHYLALPLENSVPSDCGEPLLHHFVERGAALVTAAARRDMRASVLVLREKCRALHADDRECEAERVTFLTRFLGDSCSAGPRSAALCRAVNESTFALLYLIADTDLVPDDVPGIGFADDATVFTAVLKRNERVLRPFAQQLGVDWTSLLPATPRARPFAADRCLGSASPTES